MNNVFSFTARRLVAPAAVASTFLCNSLVTRAEEDDPYANLPTEDERTSCTICLVNRQGPCRDPWRKFEKCLKDHPMKNDKEGDSDNEKSEDKTVDTEHPSVFCDRYMLPWLTCIQSYRNLYLLYFNYLNQKQLIEPMEESIREDEVFEWKHVDADWTPYVDWVKSKEYTLWDLYYTLKHTAPPITPRPTFEGEDPEMVEIEVKVKLEDNGMPLQIAYAKDQGGLLLGMEHFSEKGEDTQEKQSLKISFRPGMTSNVQLFAFYKNDKDEARLLCSAPVSLVKHAIDDGRIPEGVP